MVPPPPPPAPAHLRPCTGCARHVRASASTCPFCSAALEVDASEQAIPQERLGRAARMAFGVSAVAITVAVSGCGKDNKENIAMPYGAPPDRSMPDAGPPDQDSGKTENIMMPYGAPPTPIADAAATPPVDAGATDAGADAGKKKVVAPTPTPTPTRGNMNKPYGAPPADGYAFFDV